MQVSQQRATEAEEEQCRAEAEAAAARQELKGFQTSGAGATTASDEENVTVEQLRQVGPSAGRSCSLGWVQPLA